MLKVIQFENRSQVSDIFKKYDPSQQSWVVSDLRTKFELQRKILQTNGFFIDESVLRASDLWKALLKRAEPHLRIVSDSFAKSLLRSMMDENSDLLGVNGSAVETLFAYIDQFAPVLFHPNGSERLADWFEENSQSQDRWGAWYHRARFCVLKLVNEQKVITADWITSFLSSVNNLEHLWTYPLIVDLSGEISKVEAEILKTLSRTVDVVVLEPTPEWKDKFRYLLKPYEYLASESHEIEALSSFQSGQREIQTLRFSGMLAEIKNAVSQIRIWLQEGITPAQISILAPDVEVYWPVLQPYLEEEGIPYQKDITHKLQSLPTVVRWLASLRSRSGKLSSTDLEISFYEEEESKALRYEEFRALFKSLYAEEDLKRNSIVDRLFSKQISLSGFIPRDEFVAAALLYWRSVDSESVQVVLRELLQNAVAATTLPWNEWLSYLETIVAMKEFTLSKGEPTGLLVTKIMSGHGDNVTHRIFIGLTDEALKQKSRVQLSGDDYFSLGKDLGFFLSNPDQSDLEFELRLLADLPTQSDIYSFGLTDLSGSICSPASFWMGHSVDHGKISIPGETRWDEVQLSALRGERKGILESKERVEASIQRDLGVVETAVVQTVRLPSVSASGVESFLECPFIFAAQRYFKLEDLPDIDLDVDHRTRGLLAHALFEELTVEPMRYDWSEPELAKLLEDIRVKKEMIFADIRLWAPLKNKHIRLAQRFLEFEKNWRTDFLHTRTVGREASFKFYFEPESFEFSDEPRDGFFRISGKIDRIDADTEAKHLLVIDYKSSGGGVSAHGSWFKNRNLQLLFYMWVIEKKLLPDIEGDVIGLFYYIFRDFTRKGFSIEDMAGRLYPAPKRRDSTANLDTKEKYKTEFEQIFVNTLLEIKKGTMHPKPMDSTTCVTCKWRRQCRAPHLN